MLSLNVALLRYLRHVEDRRLLYFRLLTRVEV